ncbi:MAG: hypothetical protein L0229_01370 [Blastocatellia bacterium]|nr:hypothetical protein [Blastocatellia bacterium]
MNELTKDELTALMEKQTGPCVSILMPTHRMGKETLQDPIRFKNLIREAENRLAASGIQKEDSFPQTTEAGELLEPARRLLEDGDFWQHHKDGLAVFLSRSVFRYYRLPVAVQELAVVANRFHIKPLLQMIGDDGRFYILALSQKYVRLFEATRYDVEEVHLEDVPESLADALKYEDPQSQLQFHTGAPGGGGRRAAVFHGHGVGIDDMKDRILRYFQKIDEGLQETLKNERVPLIIASVDYMFSIYKEASAYPHIVDEAIAGNPEEVKPEELHRRARTILQPYFQRAKEAAAARFKELAGNGKTSGDLREVIPAAYHGRVESLFVAVSIERWGSFSPDTNEVEVREAARAGDEDLLDFAAFHTFLKGGTVYAVEPEEVPGGRSLAAVFRY